MEILFWATSALYWFASIGRVVISSKNIFAWETAVSILEKIAFILFTAGLVLYILQLHQASAMNSWEIGNFKKPFSWLLFAWCLNAASISMELVYSSTITAVFANSWTALALTLLPNSHFSAKKINEVFNNDLDWLNLHRLSFLLAYGFCVLAFPLAIYFLWNSFRSAYLTEEETISLERKQWKIDRMQYRLILWALPILTLGIVIESLRLIDSKELPSPLQIWNEQKDTFLALATWFICGVYLHTRLFFGWRNRRCACFYLLGLILILVGHMSSNFMHFSVSMR